MITIQCCYNCQNRAVGCHGTCQKYIEERKEYDAKRLEIRKSKAAESDYDDYIAKGNVKRLRRKTRRG